MSNISLVLNEETVSAGDRLSGKLSYATQETPKQVKVELCWYTEGRGTRDHKVIDTRLLDPERLTFGAPLPFTVQTPHEGPITYNGSLFRVMWEVKATVVFPGMLAKKEEQTQLVNVICRGL